MSSERLALIEEFKRRSAGLERSFEARVHKGDWNMPYRLFRPATSSRVPLVMYLHGSGGLGTDNEKPLGLGNIFGSRVWLMPENQRRFPCYVVAPQTDRGWVRDDGVKIVPGFGDGAKKAAEIVESLCHEFPIDRHRIYVTGQSMGGGGAWNLLTYRPHVFAGAAICCGSVTPDDGSSSPATPVWCFHGGADKTVPVGESRNRMANRRRVGGHPIYTEYAGVDHNSWEWAYTEPELPKWLFGQRLRGN